MQYCWCNLYDDHHFINNDCWDFYFLGNTHAESHKYKFIATVQVMDSWCMAILTSGGVVLRESGDTSLTCGFPFVEGGYEDGRPMEMGA